MRTCYGNVASWVAGYLTQPAYCIKTSKHILKLFRPSGSPIIASGPLRRYQVPRGIPSSGAFNTRGWKKLAIFDRYYRLSRKRCGIGDGYYVTLIGNQGCGIEWYHFRWPWVTPNTGFKVTGYLKVEYLADGVSRWKHSCRSLGDLPKTCKKLGVVTEIFWLKCWKVFYTSDGN